MKVSLWLQTVLYIIFRLLTPKISATLWEGYFLVTRKQTNRERSQNVLIWLFTEILTCEIPTETDEEVAVLVSMMLATLRLNHIERMRSQGCKKQRQIQILIT